MDKLPKTNCNIPMPKITKHEQAGLCNDCIHGNVCAYQDICYELNEKAMELDQEGQEFFDVKFSCNNYRNNKGNLR